MTKPCPTVHYTRVTVRAVRMTTTQIETLCHHLITLHNQSSPSHNQSQMQTRDPPTLKTVQPNHVMVEMENVQTRHFFFQPQNFCIDFAGT